MALEYSRIAMLNYSRAKGLVEENIALSEYSDDFNSNKNQINDSIIITVVFSAMAIESFINDYAARKFGDKFYSDNLDWLRPICKLQTISKFAFGVELIKGEKMFQSVSNLFGARNAYVHNKSKDGHGYGMTEEEFLSRQEIPTNHDELLKSEKNNLIVELKEAYKAISAICEVAKFFDINDTASHSMFMLMSANSMGGFSECELTKIQKIQREFNVKESINIYSGRI